MALSEHAVRVKARMEALATMKGTVVPKIDNDIFSVGQNEMFRQLGSSNFGSYVSMFVVNLYDPVDEFYTLKDGQRKLRMLETAEAYFCLYFLALKTKEIVDKRGFDKVLSIGDGILTPVEIDGFVDMRHQYFNLAVKLVRQYTDSGSFTFITPFNDDIGLFGIGTISDLPDNGRRDF